LSESRNVKVIRLARVYCKTSMIRVLKTATTFGVAAIIQKVMHAEKTLLVSENLKGMKMRQKRRI